MLNRKVADALNEIADLLDLQGVGFKPRAYREAAMSIESLGEDVKVLAEEGRLREIEGVGESVEAKITELVGTGSIRYLEDLRRKVPAGLVEVMRVPGLGPKRAMILHDLLGIKDLATLESAAKGHKVRALKGFGAKTEGKVLEGLGLLKGSSGRHLLSEMWPLARALVDDLRPRVQRIEVVGSLRRWKETVGDIDILAAGDKGGVMDALAGHASVEEVLAKGRTKTSVRLTGGVQADLRLLDPKAFGAGLMYFTGSKQHNIKLRKLAIDKGLKLSEYGLTKKRGGGMVAGATEEGVYKALGLGWIPPEMREDRGEVEGAQKGELPEPVALADIRGDLQVHTEWSDGRASVEAMARLAQERGYEWVALTDHSQSLAVAGGMTKEDLARRSKEVERAQSRLKVRILEGMEVDIRKDGTLDMDRRTLEGLDVVLAAVHTNFNLDEGEQTSRIERALGSGLVDVLVHPTGRILGQRAPYAIDLGRVIEAARANGVALEINAFPDRLDLDSVAAREAKAAGARLSIGTDAHGPAHLDYMQYGVAVARRAWLEAGDLLNTLPFRRLQKALGE